MSHSPVILFREHLMNQDLSGCPVGPLVHTVFVRVADLEKQHPLIVDILLHCPAIRYLVLRTSSHLPAPNVLISSLRLCRKLEALCIPVGDQSSVTMLNHLPDLRHLVLKIHYFKPASNTSIKRHIPLLALPHLTRLDIIWALQFDLHALWRYLSQCHFPALKEMQLWLSWTRGWDPEPIRAFFDAHPHITHVDLAVDHTFDPAVLNLRLPITTIRLVRVPSSTEILSLLPTTMRKLVFPSVSAVELDNFHRCLEHLAADSTHPTIKDIQVVKTARSNHLFASFRWRQVGDTSGKRRDNNEAHLYGLMLMHALRLQQRHPYGIELLDSVGRTMNMSIQ
jgi:hypothetical protein